MRILSILMMFLFLTFSLQAQDNNKKLNRKEKKELKKKNEAETHKQVSALIESKRFVFQADEIINREGKVFPASSSINFISIDSTTAVFQFGSAMLIGINGVGGVSIKGKIESFKISKTEKNGYYYLVLKVAAIVGFYDIQMDISPSGFATAKVTTSDNKKIIYKGSIVSFDNTIIYQGTTY